MMRKRHGRVSRPVVLTVATAALIGLAALPTASASAAPSHHGHHHTPQPASCLVLKNLPVTASGLDYHDKDPVGPSVGDFGTYTNIIHNANGDVIATMPGTGRVFASAVNGSLLNVYNDVITFNSNGSKVSAIGNADIASIQSGGLVSQALIGKSGAYRGWYGTLEWTAASNTDATATIQLCPDPVTAP
jgi:hypothetical protein